MNVDGFDPVLNILQLDRINPEPRIFLPRCNFDDDADWHQRYRLHTTSVEYILERIGSHLENTNRLGSLSPRQQLLLTLRFFSSNAFYHVLRDSHGRQRATLCRVVRKVTDAINNTLFNDVIRWRRQCDGLAARYFEFGGMPCVCVGPSMAL